MNNNAATQNESVMRESVMRTISVPLAVAVICALAVSLAAIYLKPRYLANLEQERMDRLGSILSQLNHSDSNSAPQLTPLVISLNSGKIASGIDAMTLDARTIARQPETSIAIPNDKDHANMKRRENHTVIYLVGNTQSRPDALVLPIWGVGYQSAIYGYLALANDGSEILGLKIYEHGETPGLGSRIQDEIWEAQWPGKQAFNAAGEISIHIGGENAVDRVDAISGATRTSMGVDGMLRFWLGDLGFGPFLDNYRSGRAGL